MRRRRCQRLLKVLRWDIITLMALLEQLVLPAEDPSFTRFSFFWTGESPRYGLQPLYFLRTAGGPAPPSGFYWILSVEWTLVSPSPQQFTWPEYMQISCCFSYSSACWGRTWCIYRYVGSTPAGRPALLWWIWWSWIDSSILHRSSTRSPFPWIDQKRMGVCMNMDAAWLACAGGGGIFSHLLYHCKRITHRSQRE